MRNLRIALLLGLAGNLACAAGPGAEGQQVNGASRLQLEFIDGQTAKGSIGVQRKIKWTEGREVDDPATNDLAKEDEKNNLVNKCGLSPPPAHPEELIFPLLVPVAVALINWVIQEVVTLAVNNISQRLDAAVKAYTRTWDTKAQTDFMSTL